MRVGIARGHKLIWFSLNFFFFQKRRRGKKVDVHFVGPECVKVAAGVDSRGKQIVFSLAYIRESELISLFFV